MANIRASYVVSTVLAVTASAVAINVAAIGGVTVNAQPTPVIKVSAFVVPMSVLENQTVLMSDFRALNISQVSIDVATATDDVALSSIKVLADDVTVTDTVNRMFYGNIDFDPTDPDADPDPITMADSDTKNVGKTLTDAATATDTALRDVGKTLSDTVSSAEEINTKHVGKSSTDAVTAADSVNTINTDKVVADSVTPAEALTKELTRPDVADSVTTADTSFRSPGLGKTDSVTSADTLNSFDIGTNPNDAVTASDAVNKFDVTTVFTDSVSITDFIAKTPGYEFDYDVVDADADPDPVTATDVKVLAIQTVYTDAVTGADAKVITVSKVLTDSATMSESINLLLTLGQSNPLYDFIGMSDDKFYYAPIGAMVNDHRIHQPLVNGEFVLTTDPNAGIVYTIRTESYSYMFAGYGLNENQLN